MQQKLTMLIGLDSLIPIWSSPHDLCVNMVFTYHFFHEKMSSRKVHILKTNNFIGYEKV